MGDVLQLKDHERWGNAPVQKRQVWTCGCSWQSFLLEEGGAVICEGCRMEITGLRVMPTDPTSGDKP